MKAIAQDRYGSADVLKLVDIDRPTVGDDQVLVQVRAAGLDQGAVHFMTGLPYLLRLGFGLVRPGTVFAAARLPGASRRSART